mmetsp:Transcript_15879/g.32539  ORF Transcript_15879/g.32539 Transcript_15879/m.32539 type:complete len:321 (+) Transcript_15879:267-1229(+)
MDFSLVFCFYLFAPSLLVVLEGDKVHHVVGPLRYLEKSTLQVRFEDDLASQPGGFLGVVGEIDHVFLGLGGLADLREPIGMDHDVAGRAGHDPAAGTLDHFSQDLGALAVSELGNVRQGHVLESLYPEGTLRVFLFIVAVAVPRRPGVRRQDPETHGGLPRRPGQLHPDALHQGFQARVLVDLPPSRQGPDHRQQGRPARDARLFQCVEDPPRHVFLVAEGGHQKGHGLGFGVPRRVAFGPRDARSGHHGAALLLLLLLLQLQLLLLRPLRGIRRRHHDRTHRAFAASGPRERTPRGKPSSRVFWQRRQRATPTVRFLFA